MMTCCPLNVSFSTDYLRKVIYQYSQEVMHIIIWVLCHHLNHTVQYSTNHATKPTCIWSKEQDQTLVKGTDKKIKLDASLLIWSEDLCLHVNLKWSGSLDQIIIYTFPSWYRFTEILPSKRTKFFCSFRISLRFLENFFHGHSWKRNVTWLHFNHFKTHTNSSWRFSGQKRQ